MFPFNRWEKEGSERLRTLPKVTQLQVVPSGCETPKSIRLTPYVSQSSVREIEPPGVIQSEAFVLRTGP